MKQIALNKISVLFVILLAVGLTVTAGYRASALSFTHDESYSYLHYVHEKFFDIFSYPNAYTNNHILNTISMKYCELLFGNSELSLRLPNLLALVLYLFYAYKIFQNHTSKFLLPFFVLITINLYLFDFFSLARGYGLSIAFMLMSVYHLIQYVKGRMSRDLVLFNLGALLATMSNFSLLNYYIAAIISYNLVMLIHPKKEIGQEEKNGFLRINKVNFVFFVISALILIQPLRRFSSKHMLDFGGKTGFVHDTFGSLINGLIYELELPPYFPFLPEFLAAFTVFFIFISIVINLLRNHEYFVRNFSHLILANFIFCFICLSSILQNLFLDNDFYTGRFALFLYPLLILNFAFYLHYLYVKGFKIFAYVNSAGAAVTLLALFAVSINLDHTKDWHYDMETKNVMNHLIEDYHLAENSTKTNPEKKINLGINRLFEPSTNFYRYTKNLNWLYPTNKKEVQKEYDYYYFIKGDSLFDFVPQKAVIFLSEKNRAMLLKN
jgi:hypothetical protein